MKSNKVIAILVIVIALLICACDDQSSKLLVDYNRDAQLFKLNDGVLELDLSKTSPSDLTDIIIPIKVNGTAVADISDSLFAGCVNLTSLRVNGMIETIKYGLLDDCINLQTLILDDGVKKIDACTLGSCTKLSLLWSLSQTYPIEVSVDDLVISSELNLKGNFLVVGVGD